MKSFSSSFGAASQELIDVLSRMQEDTKLHSAIDRSLEAILGALRCQKKILLCGNGGSAADAQHIAAEFTGRFEKDRAPIAAIALTTDTSALTAIANDYDFDAVFQRQVQALGHSGDVLVAISTSGGSRNVINAVLQARKQNLPTIGLLGGDGGALANHVDIAIKAPGTRTCRIQECHIHILHYLCSQVDAFFHPE